MSLSDAALARLLQAEFDEEDAGNSSGSANHRGVPPGHSAGSSSSKPMSLIDTQWELLDPTPDPRALFLQFNLQFFWGKLEGVEVRWSPRMTLCAGVCSYEGFGGLCSIRLSTPLLKLRPRKDLVETLLHEMIHAYLFVTQNNRDRDGHGPEFCKHKDRINSEAGTKITIYHSFHDEVENYRQHWWRCDGPCRSRKPYFGYVKRAMNRAPSRLDPWWAGHQQSCGGTYTKVKEPEGYSKKKRKKDGGESEKENDSEAADQPDKKQKREGQDIRNFIPFTGQGHRLGGTSTGKVPGPAVPPNGNSGATASGHHSVAPNSAVTQGGAPVSSENHQGEAREGRPGQVINTTNPREKGVMGSKSSQKGKVFDLVKRERKLEELRTIFLSDSEDDGELDGESRIAGEKSGNGFNGGNGHGKGKTREQDRSSADGGMARPGKSDIPHINQERQVPREMGSDKYKNRHEHKHENGDDSAPWARRASGGSGDTQNSFHRRKDSKSPQTKAIPGNGRDRLPGPGAESLGTRTGTNSVPSTRPGFDMHRKRDIPRPSSSHTGSTSQTGNPISGDITGHRSGSGGADRRERPSGQSSLDSFIDHRQGGNVRPNDQTQGQATSERPSNVPGDDVRYVKCPVCGKDIIERDINSHLDSCLSGFS